MTQERLAEITNRQKQGASVYERWPVDAYEDVRDLLADNASLRSELARVKEAAELLGHECERARYLEVLRREAPQIAGEVRRELNFAQASVDANPTAAAAVRDAGKECGK